MLNPTGLHTDLQLLHTCTYLQLRRPHDLIECDDAAIPNASMLDLPT